MPATWPATLPQDFLRRGYREAEPETTIRTETETGPAKVRRRYTAGVRRVEGSLLMTAAQVATLRTFFDTTLQGGSLPFTWTLQSTGAPATFRFLEPARLEPRGGGNWLAAIRLEQTG